MRRSDSPPEFKAIIVGDAAVGKTSLIMRFHHNVFLPDHQPTVGASFVTKTVQTPAGPANLNIWDTAGQERYRSLVPMYCRGAHVAVVVFDLSNFESFTALDGWLEQLKGTASEECTIIVVGNKLDLQSAVTEEKVTTWSAKRGVKYCAVSALSGEGISELFDRVAEGLQKQITVPVIETLTPVKTNGCC
jgi:Ras-related protein Rab-5C